MPQTNQSRRELIAKSLLAASAMALAPHVRGQDNDKKLGFCVVGIGSLSKNQIIPGLAKCKDARLVALVSGHAAEKAPPIIEKYSLNPKYVYNYDNYDSLKDNPDIDVVYVVLPNSMHAEYTIRAFKAGKNVLCEKPMAVSVEECQQMIDAGKAAGKKLQIGYRLRHEPFNMKAIELLRSGQFGAIKNIDAGAAFVIGDPKQWRLNKKLAGGGSLMDIGIYALNACRYLSGEDPVEVTAMTYSTPNDPRFPQVEETMLFTLRFASGLLANCTSSYGFGVNRYRVTCTKGVVESEPFLSYAGLRLFAQMPGKREKEELPLENVDQFAAEMDFFAQCIKQNKEPRTPGEEGQRDLKVITALYKSAESGKAEKV
ncbi:MAG TPA: Gfo/Idh/MocA family oxidoreductase [Tepidisphaeraceae bacterium]|jgi:predicted dehydrogenase